jgi:hypothetical protein
MEGYAVGRPEGRLDKTNVVEVIGRDRLTKLGEVGRIRLDGHNEAARTHRLRREGREHA